MKFVYALVILSLALVGLGAACGPEEKYCFEEHKTCAQAAIDKAAADRAERERIEAERLDAGQIGDGGATVIGQ